MLPKKETSMTITVAARGAFMAGDLQALHDALSLHPLTPSPITVDGPYPPAWVAPASPWPWSPSGITSTMT